MKKNRWEIIVFAKLLEIIKISNNQRNRYILDNMVKFNKKLNSILIVRGFIPVKLHYLYF